MATIELSKVHKTASDNYAAYMLLKEHNIDVVIMDEGYYFLLEGDVDMASEILAEAGYLLHAICHS